MPYPADLSDRTLLPEQDARLRVHIAVLMELRALRWVPWKKGMTVETVLRQNGVDRFANALVDRLTAGGLAMLKGPPPPPWSPFSVPPPSQQEPGK